MPTPLTVQVTTDRAEMRLADSLRAEVTITGPAPLRIDPPKEWLAEASAEVWRIRPLGTPKIEDLPDGGQRWTQAFRLDPFLPGEPLALVFNPVTVDGRELALNSFGIAVRTDWKNPKAEDAGPVTGIELRPPAPPQPASDVTGAYLAVAVAVVVAVAVSLWPWRKPVPPLDPEAWAARGLAALEPGTSAFPDGLAAVVRGYLERSRGIPAGQRTTVELRAAFPVAEPFLDVLERCDRARYSGEPIPAEEGEVLRRLVTDLFAARREAESSPGDTASRERQRPEGSNSGTDS